MKEQGRFWRSIQTSLSVWCLLLGLWSVEVSAQCTLACDNLVYVSLGPSCTATVEYTDLLLDPDACYPNDPEDYQVEIFNVQGSAVLPTSPMVDATNIGQTLPVKVTHLFSGAFCFTAIQVVDGLAPQIICPPDLTIECTVDPDPSVTGNPTAQDCFPSYFTYVDQYITLGCQNPQAQIIRVWTATDIYGNMSQCEQNIYIRLPNLTDIVFPPSYDNLDQPALDCQTLDLSPAALGAPNIQGQSLPEDNSCSFSAVFLDQVIPSCGQTFSIIRTWTLVEWCTGMVVSHPQIIKLEDQTAPSAFVPDTLYFLANNPSSCTANLEFPAISWQDDCTDTVTIEIQTPYGLVLGNGGALNEVPIGTFYADYLVTDDCGNTSIDSVWVVLQDQLAPTMACDQVTTINLDIDGEALVNASVFDDGSIDNCCLTFFQVARVEAGCQGSLGFSPTIAFCCADAGLEIPLRLRAFDCFGNVNECSVVAKVEDPVAPIIDCPSNQTISCLDDKTPTIFPNVTDACGVDSVYYVDQLNLNTCSTGTIERIWYAQDIHANWDSCVQIITVIDETPIDIQFPADIVITDCGEVGQAHPDLLPVPSAYPVVNGEDCEWLAISYSDQVFSIATQSCLQITRTWTVINWCEYLPNSGSTAGIYEALQIIEIIDDTPPIIDCPIELEFAITGDSCYTTILLDPPSILDCTTDWTLSVATPWGTGLGPFEEVAPGNYEVTYTVFDPCGNGTTCTVFVEVEDERKPTPLCVNGLVGILQPNAWDAQGNPVEGMAEVLVGQLDLGSFDACGEVRFSFSPNLGDTVRLFSCSELGQNLVELWVTDIYGNQGFCSTWVDVQDPAGICEPPPKWSVEGTILSETGAMIQEAAIYLMGSDTLVTLSDATGHYTFDSLSFFTGYSVEVHRDTGLLDGLTTWDLAKIKQHILGVEPLDSPYKIIAADANRSGAVTTVDLLHLQKLILLLTDELPNDNTSWRFIPADYAFTDPTSPFLDSFPESFEIDTLQASISDLNWAAIKVGDVNGSAQGSFNAWTSEQRSNRVIDFVVPSQSIAPGSSMWIPIRFNEDVSFVTMQGAVQLSESYEIREVRWPASAVITPADFYIDPDDPQGFRFATYGVQAVSKKCTDIWCEVLIQNVGMSTGTPVWSWDRRMPGLGYDANGVLYPLGWAYDSSVDQQNSLVKHWVHPNPVKAGTVIELEGLSLGTIQLEIFDTQGTLIWQTTQQVHSPQCKFPLPPTIWPHPGIYWYQVRGPEIKVSGKILCGPE